MAKDTKATAKPVGFGFTQTIGKDEVGPVLYLAIPLYGEGRLSQSHKAMTHATTEGNIGVQDGFRLGLNLFKPIDKGQWDKQAKANHLLGVAKRYVADMAKLGITVSPMQVLSPEAAKQISDAQETAAGVAMEEGELTE